MPAEPLIEADGLAVGYGGAAGGRRASPSRCRRASGWPCSGPTAAARRRCCGRCSASCARSPASLRVDASCGSVPQTERSRLDYPVSALDVATMGALSRLPWWRRPGRAERAAARAALAGSAWRRWPGRPSASSPAASASGC